MPPVLPIGPYGLCGRKATFKKKTKKIRNQSSGVEVAVLVPTVSVVSNSPCSVSGRKVTLKKNGFSECECRGARPGPVSQ